MVVQRDKKGVDPDSGGKLTRRREEWEVLSKIWYIRKKISEIKIKENVNFHTTSFKTLIKC